MKKAFKIKVYITLIFSALLFVNTINYAKANKTLEDKVEVLYLLNIVDNKENLDKPITRQEFAKMVVKASDDKDKVSGIMMESVCNDVGSDNLYAGYIKNVTDEGHMFFYLGGLFKPYDYVTYSDLTRAMLSLLGYVGDDFTGNQVMSRNLKYESLKLNDGIDKSGAEVLTKLDVLKGIYNTLKGNIKDAKDVYGLKIFDKLILDSDNELNADNAIPKKVEGPFVIKDKGSIEAPFEITKNNVYLNGVKSNIDEVKLDIDNYGYAIFYLDLDRKYIYSYTERDDVMAPIRVEKGYVQDINYAASDMTTPYRIDINSNKYYIESEEMKFAFSALGNIRVGDYIIYLCNKMNDVTNAYIDSDGIVVRNNEEEEVYKGSIIYAIKGDIR